MMTMKIKKYFIETVTGFGEHELPVNTRREAIAYVKEWYVNCGTKKIKEKVYEQVDEDLIEVDTTYRVTLS
jgi:hypothetical protein